MTRTKTISSQETEEEVCYFKNVYADIKAKLVRLGVHPSEIAFIHDAKGPAERSQLFEAVRAGCIRVLIGSTAKMGTGMNVQTRALAMHHLDAVGADHVAVLLAEAPDEQDDLMLIVDVGTNAEIALGDRHQVLVASSPTGPAFEGAQITHGQRAAPGAVERVRIDPLKLEPRYRVIGYDRWIDPQAAEDLPAEAQATGICGSGIIESIAELFLAGVLRSDGLFQAAAAGRTARLHYHGRTGEYVLVEARHSATGAPVTITQNDVRAIQLAKAALYAGAKLLMNRRGVTRVDRVVLAGAFGSFIDPYHAMLLGLIPDCDLDKVSAVGNAAGDGARLALLNRGLRLKAARLARWAEHVSTPLDPSFQDEFVAALGIPHARDAFPSLADSLPEAPTENPQTRRSKERRSGMRQRTGTVA